MSRQEKGVATIFLADNTFKKKVEVKAISTFHIDDVCCSFNNPGFSNVHFNRAVNPVIKWTTSHIQMSQSWCSRKFSCNPVFMKWMAHLITSSWQLLIWLPSPTGGGSQGLMWLAGLCRLCRWFVGSWSRRVKDTKFRSACWGKGQLTLTSYLVAFIQLVFLAQCTYG